MSLKGKLYLIPCPISEHTASKVIPLQVTEELAHIQDFLAENVRTARRFLSSLKVYPSIESLRFNILDKDTSPQELPALLKPIYEGRDMGVLSEAGSPGIADPGALAVKYAHETGIRVIPLVGPSAILLALMASGLNGQQFAFNGYLPSQPEDALKAIKKYEKDSFKNNQTQIFIETPYRNNSIFQHLIKALTPETSLCVAVDVTGEHESIQTFPVHLWRKKSVVLPKLPALFLFLASA